MELVKQVLEHDAWAEVDGDSQTGRYALRFRTPVVAADETGDYAHQLLVSWPYANEGSEAMPADGDDEAMQDFERRLCETWEHDGLAFLAAVLTFDGARRWLFYTPDPERCGERLNDLPQQDELYPIELTTDRDPQWSYLREQMLSGVDWQEHQDQWRRELAESAD